MSETLIGKAFANSFSFPGGFVIQADKPIDDRLVVHSVASLTAEDTFVEGGLSKAYNGMIVSVLETNELYILTNSAATTNINSWEKINVPQASAADAGKILTVVEVNYGTTESPSIKYEGRWVDAPSGLPEIGPGTGGKVLTISINGTPEWKDIPTELPTITDTDKGKALIVDNTGELSWSTVDTSLMNLTTTNELYLAAINGQLKPGMKYRIIDYTPSISNTYQRMINGVTVNVAKDTVKFDIIVTASSANTLFDDVELVLKNGASSSYDYSKYEAKYDLIGNFKEPKYSYINPESLGVIYYMKDQFGNEASFDFENICYSGGIIQGVLLQTFAGVKEGDLRRSGLIRNVRIKHDASILPGVILLTSSGYGKIRANNVEIDNCNGILIKETNLYNTKIINSSNIDIIMDIDKAHQFYPTFENLNICDNVSLEINCERDFNGLFESVGGLYINNLNILPSFTSKTIDLSDLHYQTANIVIQGLNDSNITRKINFNDGQNGWTPALLDGMTEAVNLLFAQYNPGMIKGKYDSLIYDSMFNASKNIKPFDIFNPLNDEGAILYTLEIPQFQSTATSVVELGI
jgi:hypothetical protein